MNILEIYVDKLPTIAAAACATACPPGVCGVAPKYINFCIADATTGTRACAKVPTTAFPKPPIAAVPVKVNAFPKLFDKYIFISPYPLRKS